MKGKNINIATAVLGEPLSAYLKVDGGFFILKKQD